MPYPFRRVILFNKISYITLLISFLIISSCSKIDLSFFNRDATPWDSPEGQSFKKAFIKNCNDSLDRLKFCGPEPEELKDLYCDCMFEKIVLKYPTYGSITYELWEYRFKLSEEKQECGICYLPPE